MSNSNAQRQKEQTVKMHRMFMVPCFSFFCFFSFSTFFFFFTQHMFFCQPRPRITKSFCQPHFVMCIFQPPHKITSLYRKIYEMIKRIHQTDVILNGILHQEQLNKRKKRKISPLCCRLSAENKNEKCSAKAR